MVVVVEVLVNGWIDYRQWRENSLENGRLGAQKYPQLITANIPEPKTNKLTNLEENWG